MKSSHGPQSFKGFKNFCEAKINEILQQESSSMLDEQFLDGHITKQSLEEVQKEEHEKNPLTYHLDVIANQMNLGTVGGTSQRGKASAANLSVKLLAFDLISYASKDDVVVLDDDVKNLKGSQKFVGSTCKIVDCEDAHIESFAAQNNFNFVGEELEAYKNYYKKTTQELVLAMCEYVVNCKEFARAIKPYCDNINQITTPEDSLSFIEKAQKSSFILSHYNSLKETSHDSDEEREISAQFSAAIEVSPQKKSPGREDSNLRSIGSKRVTISSPEKDVTPPYEDERKKACIDNFHETRAGRRIFNDFNEIPVPGTGVEKASGSYPLSLDREVSDSDKEDKGIGGR